MRSKKYLILHKDEWERIKRQRQTCEVPAASNEDVNRMQQLSQEWIKSWPDTVNGHIEILKKIEARKRKKDIEEIKRFALQKKKDSSLEAIQKARQIIFEDSCYGKQLISCLIESKTIEEREAQLKFKRNLKEKKLTNEKEIILKEKQRNIELDNMKRNKLQQKQKNDREIAEINKKIFETQNTKTIRYNELQKQADLKDMEINKNFLENETKCRIQDKIEANRKTLQDNVKYIQCKKNLDEHRRKEQEGNERIDQLWHDYYDRVRRKKNIVNEEMKKKVSEKKMCLFQNLEQIKKLEEEKYNNFVNRGIQRLEEKIRQTENQKLNIDNIKPSPMKIIIEEKKHTRDISKVCHCDRQTLIKKPKKNCNNPRDSKKDESLQFMVSSKRLVGELKKREQEPFPWSGTKAAHEQFAQQADTILGECRFKRMARKVVHEYRKINGLNTNDLPIPNL